MSIKYGRKKYNKERNQAAHRTLFRFQEGKNNLAELSESKAC
jgi:hypothetical protein